MPIHIMPILLPQILPHLIIPLRNLQHPQIHIHDPHTLLGPHLHNRPNKRKRDLRHAQEIFRGTRSIDKDDPAGILEAASRQCRV